MKTTILLLLAAASLAPIGCKRTTVVERPVVTERERVIEKQQPTVIERHDHYVAPPSDTTVIERRPSGSTTVIERR